MTDKIKLATDLYSRAAKDLGPKLSCFCICDLFADNFDWSLAEVYEVCRELPEEIKSRFPRCSAYKNA